MKIDERTHRRLDGLAASHRPVRVFGVEYIHLDLETAGDLYVTSFGLPHLPFLLPDQWRDKQYYAQPENKAKRVRLPGSANPHRITTKPVDGRTVDLVVKWCRVGSEVHVYQTPRADFIPAEALDNARWNSPFEEIGLLQEIRQANQYYTPRLLTQRPLAVYSPREAYPLWRLGRNPSRWKHHTRQLEQDQYGLCTDDAIGMDIHKLYGLIYEWVDGEEATVCFPRAGKTEQELADFTRYVYYELLLQRGYDVADTKPAHFIMRTRGDDLLTDGHGRPHFVLIDFELLRRTPDYELKFRQAQRSKYFRIQHKKDVKVSALPPAYAYQNVFGVDYTFAHTSNGGWLWAVGNQPELVDFFEPSRWRSQPRIQLSALSYRARTQDDIQLVYRRSRCGIIPEPSRRLEEGASIRRRGYNSPFEEVAIAEQLRAHGLASVYPRAVYRTAHQSLPAEWLLDESRYHSHKNLRTPDGHPILNQDHDYFVLWGNWRGYDPLGGYREDGHWGMIDLEQAVRQRMIDEAEYHRVWNEIDPRLKNLWEQGRLREDRFILHFNRGRLARNESGRLQVAVAVNADRAVMHHRLSESTLDRLVESVVAKLTELGFNWMNPKSDYLILTVGADGELVPDPSDPTLPHAVLCNFELIHAPWMHYGRDREGE